MDGKRIGLMLAAGLLVLPLAAGAWQFEGGAGLGVEFSDNLNLSPFDPRHGNVLTAVAGGVARESGSLIDSEIRAIGELRSYRGGIYDDDLWLTLDGTANWHIVPRRIDWLLEDHYRQALIDPLAVPTPANRQGTNLFSTGPRVQYDLTPRQQLAGELRWASYWAEISDTDNTRITGEGSWSYRVSPRAGVSLNANRSDVDYLASSEVGFVRTELFAGGNLQTRGARIELAAGSSTADPYNAPAETGALLRADVNWQTTRYTELVLNHRREYSDTGSELGFGTADELLLLLDRSVTSDIYYIRRTDLRLHRNGALLGYDIGGGIVEEDYRVVALDQRMQYATGRIGYRLQPTLEGALFANWYDTDYRLLGQSDTTITLGIELEYLINSRLSLLADLLRHERQSTLASREFIEHVGAVSLRYGDLPTR